MSDIVNKTARYDYVVGETYTAGVVLSGPEVKSARLGQGGLNGSYVKIIGQEAFLINANISPYKFASQDGYDPKRSRKLLLRRHEIDQLIGLAQRKNVTLIPLALGVRGRRIKLTFGVGTGKKAHEKRSYLKKRDEKRQLDRDYKTRLKGF